MAMIDGGKHMTIKDVRTVNVVLEYLGLPPVAEGVPGAGFPDRPEPRCRQVPLGRLRAGRAPRRAGHLPRHDLGPVLHLHRPDHGHGPLRARRRASALLFPPGCPRVSPRLPKGACRRMSATTSAALVLAVMVAAFVAAKLLKVSTELSLFAAALAGALAGGSGIPARHIVEGAFTYFDIVLIFVTATLFMNLLKESGGGRVRRPGHPAPLPPAQGRCCSSCWPCCCSSPGR
ncbi:MAG: hypothetical protein MZV63_58630 [Marinilabiliales bacterium]|nr:hypothetical protein [Marinilabiliales bacterium]